jgi:23S rRNA (guanosine2251-2'-O)-methyltransferase
LQDSKDYLNKKAFFNKILTIYGRKSVLEALLDESLDIYKLHLSTSNQKAPIIDKIITLANKRDIKIVYHDKQSLSQISKNAKQDQGVALDIVMNFTQTTQEFLSHRSSFRVLALDGITNPQNLGMIIRSAAAGNIDAIIIPEKKTASINPLVIKASVGTIFRMPIIKTKSLHKTLSEFKTQNTTLYTLSSHAQNSYKDESYPNKTIFVLGNESIGVSKEIESICDKSIKIPMQRGVESLNVAVTASLLAFM